MTRVLESTNTSSQWPSAHEGKLVDDKEKKSIESGKAGGPTEGMFVIKRLFCQMPPFSKKLSASQYRNVSQTLQLPDNNILVAQSGAEGRSRNNMLSIP